MCRGAFQLVLLTQFKGTEAMVSSALVRRHDTLGHQEACWPIHCASAPWSTAMLMGPLHVRAFARG